MKNNDPHVSIIINCFNGEKFLNEALNSVLNQSYNNWEVIFWDNQSTDTSAKIFKTHKDKRFKYFYATEHTSLYKARNLAIKETKGDFISFLDTDDVWDRKKLELQMPYFDNPEVGLVFSNLWLLKQNVKRKKIFVNKKLPRGNIYNELINNYCIGILTTVIRKKSYLQLNKKFDERFSIVGDFDLFIRLSKICLFESIQEPLAFYRLHGKNLSTLSKEKEIDELNIWLSENKFNLNDLQIQKMQNEIDYKNFLNCKINGKYIKSIKILLNSKIGLFKLKNLLLLLIPNILLKKILWFHNDFS